MRKPSKDEIAGVRERLENLRASIGRLRGEDAEALKRLAAHLQTWLADVENISERGRRRARAAEVDYTSANEAEAESMGRAD